MRAEKADIGCTSGETILIALLEAIVDRLADVLERASREVIDISHDIFHPTEKKASKRDRDFQLILQPIGRKEDLVSKIQDSLLTLQRLSGFLAHASRARQERARTCAPRVKTLSRDVLSLSDHATFLSQKITFLLDATLGMINIEQNAIIKIVSVAAVVFLPPTLVASIYGMNFDIMPELKWLLGYPFAHRPDGRVGRPSLLVLPPQGLALTSRPRAVDAGAPELACQPCGLHRKPGPSDR